MLRYILLLFLLPFSVTSLWASPQEVRAGVHLLSLTKFNTAEGSYQIDFYLTLTADTAFDDHFDLQNGHILSKTLEDNMPNFKVYRIKAVCFANLDFHLFPFDKHVLGVQIEHTLKNNQELVFISDTARSGLDSDVGLVGWEIGNPAYYEQTGSHFYKSFQQSYSRYSFYITLQKPFFASVMKGLIPPFITLLVLFLMFMMNPKEPKDRVNASASLLIANVVLHINSTSGLPPLGYAVFLDKIMICNYVVLAWAFINIMLLIRLQQKGFENKLQLFNKRSMFAGIVGYLLLVTVLMFS